MLKIDLPYILRDTSYNSVRSKKPHMVCAVFINQRDCSMFDFYNQRNGSLIDFIQIDLLQNYMNILRF